MTLVDIKSKLDKVVVMKNIAIGNIDRYTAEKTTLEKLRANLDIAQALAQKVAKDVQERDKYNLEDIVNLALDAIFPGMYTFNLIFETKRNQTEARIVLLENGVELDPEDTGGGLMDVLAFTLRMALLIISKQRRTLILDEPMKNVSEGLKMKVYEIIRQLSTDMGIQVIAVTHDPLFIDIADSVYAIRKEEGEAYVTKTV